ncbi:MULTISPECIES: type VI secretion system Vgr family protein [Rhizobium/Agrobacterium group]|uniref:VgrG protein n=2 Tax=Rhizobium/Agrobacterium group TaxID=227290 RepID=B9JZ85_ALLAM|nr:MULTISPECIES: type VI secretion system tip protein TssI/VgrG [Rhizobium/Agrobacterium group]ACM37330.1 vgrG protein [Allorhizobium ampelinum S4]MCF1448811.1 type VI secretion system tip protein VgrG [Allorhizobium ampelinum]MCF1492330.1 type VI secretion system tip protein VgrG [Allorhizobium ampelinum]MUO30155.1 type VI secretion system tip protein VgrG [Agrobacterium vitis]MUO45020.1 type VI secretion system tip protein VgrG [Agrobacterium vitis]
MFDDILTADFIQASRVLKVSSPLGEDQLLPERMKVDEGVNRLFEITLHVRAKREAVKPEELIGKLVDISLEIRQGELGEDGLRRPFNGLVTDLEEGPPVTRGLRSYTLTIRPQMWLLSRRSDCRIWLDMTSIQVLETLFSEHGLPQPDIGFLQNKPPAQGYSVQWQESDLDYLLRRLEEDGIFYWFQHDKGIHRLRVTDHQIAWSKASASAEGDDTVRIAQGSSDRNHITEWMRRFSYVPGQRVDADWNFETPNFIPRSQTPSLVELPGNAKRELYNYPARAADYLEMERVGKLRAQATQADHERVKGQSTVRVLEPGRRFNPYEEPHPEHKYEEHVITRITHWVVDRSYETTENQPEYINEFGAIPSRIPLTPHRTTKRPRIEGAQVAIVAGPSGEEIHPDKYGRIKAWFPWDRRAKKDGSDTCWIRVSQSWAGGLWGSQVIPRIGMEVMIAYIDGDPDRPLVTGVVPNTNNPVPYDLPANKTRSVFKTKTHKGFGSNEIRLEDENGREEFYIHAQRDKNIVIENDFTKIIKKDSATKVERDSSDIVTNNKSSYTGGNHEINVGGNINISAGNYSNIQQIVKKINYSGDKIGKFIKRLSLPRHQSVGQGSLNISVQNTKMETVGVNSTELIGGIKSQFVKFVSRIQVGRDYIIAVGHEHHEVVGKIRTIKSGEKISLICGNSRIEMTEDGSILIEGNQIKIKGDKINLN